MYNEKDYKAIAEIIKISPRYQEDKIVLAKRFAKYFEKEDKGFLHIHIKGNNKEKVMFNRKQFLKDCGVKE